MRPNRPALLFLLLPLVLPPLRPVGASADPRPASDAAEFVAETDAWTTDALARLEVVPGAAMAVVVGNEIVLANGWGTADREANLPSTADTQFYIASATKPFTGLLAALLDERGEMDLQSSLASHLDGASMPAELRPDEVKLANLLSHTSGIDNGGIGFRVAYSGQHDAETLWSLIPRSTPMPEAPLGTYRYTNVGYNVYTMLLDRESGTPWQDRLQTEIFGPLGLARTTAYVSVGKEAGWPAAAPYFGLDPGGVIRVPLEKRDNTMQSAGGMMTTANDAARWLVFQVNEGRLDGDQLVDAEVVRRTQAKLAEFTERDPIFGEATGYGLGWEHASHAGHAVLAHGGGFPGFRSLLSFMPEAGIGVAFFVNEGSLGGELLVASVRRAYDWWLGRDLSAHDARIDAAVKRLPQVREQMAAEAAKRAAREWHLSRPRAAYAGTYTSEVYGTVVVSETEGELNVRLGNLHCVPTAFEMPETMRVELVPGRGEVIAFEPAEGAVERLVYDGETFTRAGGS